MKESRSSAVKIPLCAAVLIASVLLCSPVSAALEKLTGDLFDWTVPFRLAAMVSGLVLLAALLRLFFHKWAPKTNRGRTAFTLRRLYRLRNSKISGGISLSLYTALNDITKRLSGNSGQPFVLS